MADLLLQSPNPHFFQPLLPGFNTHLTIPVTFFLNHIEGKTKKKTVKLKSDASDTVWKVKLNGLRLTKGWEEFAIAHDLRIGDIIVFRQEGDMEFHVTPFGPSCCEIQYTPSRNRDDDDDDYEDQDNISKVSSVLESKITEKNCFHDSGKVLGKRNLKRKTEQESSLSDDENYFVAYVTTSNLRFDTLYLPKRVTRLIALSKENQKITLVNSEGRTWKLALKFRDSTSSYYMKGAWKCFCHENGRKVGDSFTFKVIGSEKSSPMIIMCSAEECWDHMSKYKMRNKVKKNTKKRRQWVEASSSASSRQNRFVTIILTPYNFKSSKLILPVGFTEMNGINKVSKIILLDKNGEKR